MGVVDNFFLNPLGNGDLGWTRHFQWVYCAVNSFGTNEYCCREEGCGIGRIVQISGSESLKTAGCSKVWLDSKREQNQTCKSFGRPEVGGYNCEEGVEGKRNDRAIDSLLFDVAVAIAYRGVLSTDGGWLIVV